MSNKKEQVKSNRVVTTADRILRALRKSKRIERVSVNEFNLTTSTVSSSGKENVVNVKRSIAGWGVDVKITVDGALYDETLVDTGVLQGGMERAWEALVGAYYDQKETKHTTAIANARTLLK